VCADVDERAAQLGKNDSADRPSLRSSQGTSGNYFNVNDHLAMPSKILPSAACAAKPKVLTPADFCQI